MPANVTFFVDIPSCVTKILIMQEMQLIDDLLWIIVHSYMEIWFHGRAKNKLLLLDQYQVMARATCELLWLKHLLQKHFCEVGPMELVCYNQSAFHHSSNLVFHKRTKHIQVDCHFLRENILSEIIRTSFSIYTLLVEIEINSEALFSFKCQE